MTAIGRDEAVERLEAAWTCEHLACLVAREQRDSARSIAARLEAENAALRVLIREERTYGSLGYDLDAHAHLSAYAETGTLSADALALVEHLS